MQTRKWVYLNCVTVMRPQDWQLGMDGPGRCAAHTVGTGLTDILFDFQFLLCRI